MGIIKSILDTDLYKITMSKFVLDHYPNVDVEYNFIDRDHRIKLSQLAFERLKSEIRAMENLQLSGDEFIWIENQFPFLPVWYLVYLKNYRFDSNEIFINLDSEGYLELKIIGKWRRTILWEVPILALISEIFFLYEDSDWNEDLSIQKDRAIAKSRILTEHDVTFSDFSTRRRRNFATQDLIVREMKTYSGFNGTSNPYFAMKYNVKCHGTIAHEAIMAVSVLESLNHANRYTMELWQKSYQANLGIMLTDTFGATGFLNDFDLKYAKVFDGVRHDSADPFQFADTYINHYKKLNIDPTNKLLLFSDSLTVDLAVRIRQYCGTRCKMAAGIGTHFSNDYNKISNSSEKSKAANIVIKLASVNGIPVCKLSDSPTKATGDKNAVAMAKYIYFNEPICK